MKKVVVVLAFVIIVIVGFSAVWYILATNSQTLPSISSPSPTTTNTQSPTAPWPKATVTANISTIPNLQLNGSLPNSGDTLIINGTVTNSSPNNAYNVGLRISAEALVLGHYRTVIDVTIPIKSGTYNTGTTYTLSTLAPYESTAINAVIYPDYESQEPNLQGANVTVVWSNMT